MRLPPLIPVRQHVRGRPIAGLAQAVRREIVRCRLLRGLNSGARIGVAVGSRGVANLAAIVSTLVAMLRECGAIPGIIPAMGSHGGATAAGQREVLASLGVSADSVGARVCPRMAVQRLG